MGNDILDELETRYKQDKYSLDIVQLRTLVDYLFIQIEEEQNKNVDFCSEWLHKSKVYKKINELQKEIDEITVNDTQLYGEYALLRYTQATLEEVLKEK